MSYNYMIKYPFSNKAKEYLEKKNIDLLSVSEDIIKKSTLFILKTISQNMQDNEAQWKDYLKIDDERIAKTMVMLYPVSRLLLNYVDYNPLYQKFGDYFQKQFLYYIVVSSKSELLEIQKDILPSLKYDTVKQKYYLTLVEYLSYNFTDNFALKYSNLEKGNIYFSKEQTFVLLSLVLKKRILKGIDFEKKEFPQIFKDYGEYIKKKVMKDNILELKIINKPPVGSFPPCFLKMYNKLIAGERLTHIENFNIGVFLFNIGYTFEEVLHHYKNSPNYDEKIASYQIKKIFEKKYSVPNCETLKSNGLCVNNCNTKHPFQLFKKVNKK